MEEKSREQKLSAQEKATTTIATLRRELLQRRLRKSIFSSSLIYSPTSP